VSQAAGCNTCAERCALSSPCCNVEASIMMLPLQGVRIAMASDWIIWVPTACVETPQLILQLGSILQ